MGTGKNAVGRLLAKRLGSEYIDIDEMIEKDQGMKITDIFEKKGEPYFRKVEKRMVRIACESRDQVIAAGGGAVLFEENMENFRKDGIIICLTARPEVILDRTRHASHRPLLNVEDPLWKIKELLKIREPFYAKADFSIDTSDISVEEIVNKIIEITKDDR
jgi:shikimate kinase